MFTSKPRKEDGRLIGQPPPLESGSSRGPQPFHSAQLTSGDPIEPVRSSGASEPCAYEEGLVIIGKGTRVHGKIADCRKLDVHGILEGDVVTDLLVVRDGGGIKGTVTAHQADVHGVFEGTLVVQEHLDIQRTGHVTGEISYGTLAIQTGARMLGNLACREPDPAPARAPEPTAEILSFNGHHNSANESAFEAPSQHQAAASAGEQIFARIT